MKKTYAKGTDRQSGGSNKDSTLFTRCSPKGALCRMVGRIGIATVLLIQTFAEFDLFMNLMN